MSVVETPTESVEVGSGRVRAEREANVPGLVARQTSGTEPASCCASGTRHRWGAGVLAAGVLIVGAGWFFHTSPRAEVAGKYSAAWATFLACVLGVEIAALWGLYGARRNLRTVMRRVLFASVAVGSGAALILPSVYIFAHERFLSGEVFRPMWAREHPFLQWDHPMWPEGVAKEKGPGVFRVVCMGGSTTQGYGVAPEESYPAQLAGLLAERFPERRIEVINAGSCWHTTLHTLVKYLGTIGDYEPDLILEMHAWNDVYQCGEVLLSRGAYRADYGHFLGALTKRLRPTDRVRGWVVHNPFFDNWFSDFRGEAAVRREGPVDPLIALASYRRNLGHMAELCAADGVGLVLMSQPFLYKAANTAAEVESFTYDDIFTGDEVPSVEAMRGAMEAFNGAAREMAREKGLGFIDLEAVIPKDRDYFVDDVHWTGRGYERVSRAVLEGVDWEARTGPDGGKEATALAVKSGGDVESF